MCPVLRDTGVPDGTGFLLGDLAILVKFTEEGAEVHRRGECPAPGSKSVPSLLPSSLFCLDPAGGAQGQRTP